MTSLLAIVLVIVLAGGLYFHLRRPAPVKFGVVLFAIAFAAGLYYFIRPAPLTETERIYRQFEAARVAVEKKQVGKLMSFLSNSYVDNEGNTKQMIRQYVAGYLLRSPRIGVRYSIRKTEIRGDHATVDLRVIVTDAGTDGQADMTLKVELAMENGDWKVVRASGVQIANPEP